MLKGASFAYSRIMGLVRSKAPLLVVALALPLLLANLVSAHQADVELIPQGRYVDVVVREVRQAKASIHLTMYLIALPPTRRGSTVYALMDALVEAKDRGVDVQVVLDENYAWDGEDSRSVRGVSHKNELAARALQARGVRVFLDDAATLTHAKALVIDGHTVILGSTNWSEAALTRNMEATVLIRSEVVAQELLAQFAGAGREGLSPRYSEGTVPEGPATRVPWAFLTNRAQLGRMVAVKDERAFDAYLMLLKMLGTQEGRVGVVDSETLRAALGLGSRYVGNNQRAIRRILRRLQDQYGVITYAMERGEDTAVSLRTMEGEDAEAVEVPSAYWDWGWTTTLTFPGKVMYLLGLHYAAVSPTTPVWFRATGDLAARHGVSRAFVEDGLMGLRRHNLVEVAPGRLNPADYGDREANRYALNPLYDPKTVAQAFHALARRYGTARVARVTGYLAVVYENSDVEAAERLLELEEVFGPEVVRRAVAVVGAMSGNNPKKTIGYLIATIQGMGSREGSR